MKRLLIIFCLFSAISAKAQHYGALFIPPGLVAGKVSNKFSEPVSPFVNNSMNNFYFPFAAQYYEDGQYEEVDFGFGSYFVNLLLFKNPYLFTDATFFSGAYGKAWFEGDRSAFVMAFHLGIDRYKKYREDEGFGFISIGAMPGLPMTISEKLVIHPRTYIDYMIAPQAGGLSVKPTITMNWRVTDADVWFNSISLEVGCGFKKLTPKEGVTIAGGTMNSQSVWLKIGIGII